MNKPMPDKLQKQLKEKANEFCRQTSETYYPYREAVNPDKFQFFESGAEWMFQEMQPLIEALEKADYWLPCGYDIQHEDEEQNKRLISDNEFIRKVLKGIRDDL